MKTVFWNVDTQYDFMGDSDNDFPGFKGSLFIPGSEEIKPNLYTLTKLADKRDIVVVNSGDLHDPDDEEFSDKPDFINTFHKHGVRYTLGSRFIPQTSPYDAYQVFWDQEKFDGAEIQDKRNIVIWKNKFDVFKGNPYTIPIIEFLDIGTVFVYGVATDKCVNDAILGLEELGLKVFAVIDAMKELPNASLKEIFDEWYRKDIISIKTSEVKDYLEQE